MKKQAKTVIVIAMLCILISPQSIVDFSYSQYAQKQKQKEQNSGAIVINPDRQLIEGYDFPAACDSAAHLSEDKKIDEQELQSLDIDGLMDGLRSDFMNLLGLGEKIKRKRSNVEGIYLE